MSTDTASPTSGSGGAYTLQVGEAGRERLALINHFYNSTTEQFLQGQRLVCAHKVLEVGCGIGQLARWMAKKIDTSGGRVLAIDASADQLEIAETEAQWAGLRNLEHRHLSVFDLHELAERFDLIHCRFVLVHTGRHEAAIAAMRDALNPGGVLICEEATASSCYSKPHAQCLDRWLSLWRHLRQVNAAELDLGGQLSVLFAQAGLLNVEENIEQPLLDSPEQRRIFRLNVIETMAVAVRTGYGTAFELEQLCQDLRDWEQRDVVAAYMKIHQVRGVRADS